VAETHLARPVKLLGLSVHSGGREESAQQSESIHSRRRRHGEHDRHTVAQRHTLDMNFAVNPSSLIGILALNMSQAFTPFEIKN
jgi:hypothetical protein